MTSETLQSASPPETLTSNTLSIADVSNHVSDLTKTPSMTATERHLGEGRSILRMDETGMRHWQRPATTNRKAQS
jgi:hypothetical protein